MGHAIARAIKKTPLAFAAANAQPMWIRMVCVTAKTIALASLMSVAFAMARVPLQIADAMSLQTGLVIAREMCLMRSTYVVGVAQRMLMETACATM